jgi:hypothetical protein
MGLTDAALESYTIVIQLCFLAKRSLIATWTALHELLE